MNFSTGRILVSVMVLGFAALDIGSMLLYSSLIPSLANLENNLFFRVGGAEVAFIAWVVLHLVIVYFVLNPPVKKKAGLMSFVVFIMLLCLGHAFGTLMNTYTYLSYKAGDVGVIEAAKQPMSAENAAINGLFGIFFLIIPVTLYTYITIIIYDYYLEDLIKKC